MSLNLSKLELLLKRENYDYSVFHFKEIDSTNNFAKQYMKNCSENKKFIFIADSQTDGKGRMGRSFISPDNNGLYMTIGFPEFDFKNIHILTVLVATAVAQCLDELCNSDFKIKWVNDILLNGKKICGILSESSIDAINKKINFAVVGIGINLYGNNISPEIDDIASTVEKETGLKIDIEKLVVNIIKWTEYYLSCLPDKSFIKKYKKKSSVIGKRIVVNNFVEEFECVAKDIDENAHLVVENNGETFIFNSGEISIKPV